MKDRIVAIDYGLKRIGLAVSDALGILASPWGLVEASHNAEITIDRLLAAVAQIEKERGAKVGKLLIGLPLNMNGQEGVQATAVQEFTTKLRARTPLEVVTWDERLTTAQAERGMREAGFNRKKRQGIIDKAAAAIILQSYLDSGRWNAHPSGAQE